MRQKRNYLFLGFAVVIVLGTAFAFNLGDIQTKFENLQLSPGPYTDLISQTLQACEARHSEIEYIEITTCEGLKGIDNGLNGNYRLMNDLVCSFEPIAFGEGEFKGIFDGQGHKITYSFDSNTHGKIGLFSDIGECGIVKNLHVYADVSGTSSVGAIAGYVYKGILKEVYATGNVEAIGQDAGGLVGGLKSGGILDSYSEAAVSGNDRVGGVAGAAWNFPNNEQRPIIKNSYANANVAGNSNVGGLAGLCDYPAISSYWNLDKYSGNNGCGIGKTDAEMKQQATFLGWDFTNIWRIDSGDYPRLQWQQSENCIEVWTAQDLDNVRNDLTACYKQMADIDLSSWGNWGPIGGRDYFIGIYDGQGYKISNLRYYTEVPGDKAGLFSYLADGGVIKNLEIENVSVKSNRQDNQSIVSQVGGLVGYILGGYIDNINLAGVVSGGTHSSSGCLAGSIYNYQNYNDIQIGNINFSCAVAGITSGGLIGHTSRYSGTEGKLIIRDVIGFAQVSGDVFSGGIIGSANDFEISKVESNGRVIGDDNVGGIVGSLIDGSIIDSSFFGDVEGNNQKTGGLAGYAQQSLIENSNTQGSVEGSGSIGGLLGSIWNSTIRNSFSISNIRSPVFSDGVGGLIGRADKGIILEGSYYKGYIEAEEGLGIGGLIGEFVFPNFIGSITNSYSEANISVYNCGSVFGEDIGCGGLIGNTGNFSNIIVDVHNSYSSGRIETSLGEVYGLIGSCNQDLVPNVVNSYWNQDIIPNGNICGGEGRTTQEMTSVPRPGNTYVNWDFVNVWGQENGNYPFLIWQR